ncbi:hypothetical protein D7W81_24795 [Corallococcus aberystwythensis]|uniref:Uncharacterized protein n=2 Tax=Corallococcus aberystwythensis TaxID=2316722 RepID=A0A3A8PWZ3_9BACT|nr:hypothetical protein D7W81_24795 [Corallococcus aberystwythensis]
MCNWANRPSQSVCTAQHPNDSWSSWDRTHTVPCAGPTASPPSTYWFDLSPTVPAPLDGYNGRHTQQWNWPDGRYLSGWGQSVIHCPSNPSQWGTSLFTMPLLTAKSDHAFLRIPGFLSHSQARYVRGQVKVLLYAQRPVTVSLPGIDMSATLALQTLGLDDVWRDVATRVLPAPGSHRGIGVHEFFEIEALIQPYTPVRVELRANTLPPLRVADADYIWENYNLVADIIDARLILPDCIPDQSRPGFCL